MALKTKNNYVSGTIGKTMLKTALSMIPGTLAISGFNLADSYFVAQLGRDQQAAIGLTFPVIMLLGCFFRGILIFFRVFKVFRVESFQQIFIIKLAEVILVEKFDAFNVIRAKNVFMV